MRKEMRAFFLFYATTHLGSCLSAIATFLQIDTVFGSITYLGVALSLKTLFLMAGGFLAPRVILKLGLRRTLVVSQCAGIFFLTLLYLGFTRGNFYLVLAGIFATSLPSLLLSVVCSSLYRLAADTPEDFRKLQGTQGTVGGVCFLAAGLATPFLMKWVGFNAVLAIDGATFLVGAVFLGAHATDWIEALNRDGRPAAPAAAAAPAETNLAWALRDARVPQFGAYLSSTYLLIGLVPLVAISGQSLWSDALKGSPHGLFWAIEAVAQLLGGAVYRAAAQSGWLQSALGLPIPLGLLLIPLALSSTPLGVGLSLCALSLSMVLRFMKTRDDFILQFESKEDTVRASAWVSSVVHFLMFSSPLYLMPLIRKESSPWLLVVVCLLVQTLLIIAGLLIQSDRMRVQARKSLNDILMRLTSYSLIALGVSLSAVVITVLYFSIAILYQRQADTWVESFPRSVIPHLVESDYLPLDSKVQLLQKSRVFKSFEVRDRAGDLISHFGEATVLRGDAGPAQRYEIKDEAGVSWGTFEFRVDRSFYIKPFLLISLISMLLTAGATMLARWLLRRRLKSEFDGLTVFLKEIEALALAVDAASSARRAIRAPGRTANHQTTEEAQIKVVVDTLTNKIDEYQKTMSLIEVEKRRSEIVAEIARQVAHDIRSPLAALEVAAADLEKNPGENRLMISGAIGRIRDIANDLLDKNRATLSAAPSASVELLSSHADALVSEKRLQYRSRSGVHIEFGLDASAYGAFSNIKPHEFKRLLSNLINNSVEAFDLNPGTVCVHLTARDGNAVVRVTDDGKGIPPEVLSRIGRPGETHGKAGGSGLGLHHAKTALESVGGRLEIASTPGKGTTASVILPLMPAPDWFASDLTLAPAGTVVVLDDDDGIHQIWNGRFEAAGAALRGTRIVHLTTPGEFRRWIANNPPGTAETRYLFDQDLGENEATGLALAEEYGLGERLILVTSHYGEPAIQARCAKMKARMIPKGLARFVPISVSGAAEAGAGAFDAVLIDDDALLRKTWTLTAEKAGKRLLAFASPAEFLSAAESLDRRTPVYIDEDLGDGITGTQESLRIHEAGFQDITLTTGYEPERFKRLPHLRRVIGKTPPWA